MEGTIHCAAFELELKKISVSTDSDTDEYSYADLQGFYMWCRSQIQLFMSK